MSQNLIDEANCDWSNIEDVKSFIKKREVILKEYIYRTFEIE